MSVHIPQIIRDLPFDDYLAIDAMSASALRALAQSPRHFYLRQQRPETKALGRGTIAHVAALEPKRLARYEVLPETRIDAKGKEVKFVRSGQYWDAFKEEHSDAEGILTRAEWEEANLFASALVDHSRAQEVLAGEHEVTLIWYDPLWGLSKARLDVLAPTHIADLKTARDISPIGFGYAAKRYGYHLQAAWYRRGARAVVIADVVIADMPFFFVALESAHPHDAAVYRVGDDMLRAGEKLLDRLYPIYREAIDADRWPGAYPEEDEVFWPEEETENLETLYTEEDV